MPRYRNNTLETITPSGGWAESGASSSVAPGGILPTKDYLKNPGGLTLVGHAAEGFAGVELYDSTVPSGTVEQLYAFDFIEIKNITDDVIQVQPNNDSTNMHRVPAGAVLFIENRRLRRWFSCSIFGSGSGNVQVIGSNE